jgi:hypothetical protein
MNEPQQRRYDELVRLVESKGGKMNSDHYVGEETRISVECEFGHTWRPTPDQLSRNQWCAKCSAEDRHITPAKVAAKLAEKGGRMIGQYISRDIPFEVACQYNHTWKTTWDRLRSGRWCVACAGRARITTESVTLFVEERGGKPVMGTNGWRKIREFNGLTKIIG